MRGAHITVGHGKVRETVGVPGSGLSYITTQSTGDDAPRPSILGRIVRVVALGIVGALVLSILALWALATFLR